MIMMMMFRCNCTSNSNDCFYEMHKYDECVSSCTHSMVTADTTDDKQTSRYSGGGGVRCCCVSLLD